MSWPGEKQRHAMSARGVSTKVHTKRRGPLAFMINDTLMNFYPATSEQVEEFADENEIERAVRQEGAKILLDMGVEGAEDEYLTYMNGQFYTTIWIEPELSSRGYTVADVRDMDPQLVLHFVRKNTEESLMDMGFNGRAREELYDRYDNITKSITLDKESDDYMYALFDSSVRFEDKYNVTTAPGVFFGSEMEAKEHMERRGFTGEDTQIMKYNRRMADEIMERKAEQEIEKGGTVAHDVADERGQIFDNVKHMLWFKHAVAVRLNEEGIL